MEFHVCRPKRALTSSPAIANESNEGRETNMSCQSIILS